MFGMRFASRTTRDTRFDQVVPPTTSDNYFIVLKQYQRLIGAYVITFSQLEGWLNEWLVVIAELQKEGPVTFRIMDMRLTDRVDLVADCLKFLHRNDRHAEIDDWRKRFRRIVETRNKMVHGRWGTATVGSEFGLGDMSFTKRAARTTAPSERTMTKRDIFVALRALDKEARFMIFGTDLFRRAKPTP